MIRSSAISEETSHFRLTQYLFQTTFPW